MFKPSTCLSTLALATLCSLSFVHSANANTTTAVSVAKSGPTFLGDGGTYPFSEAVRVGNTLYMSGQIGFKDGKLVKGGIKAETKQVLDNIHGTLLKYGYQKSDIVKWMTLMTLIRSTSLR
jgi:2-iminobutanoate/2-iminopropanoate deaminase